MRTVKLITWNPQDEVYEMSLGTLTATHISSSDISCADDLHVGGNLWVGDEFLTAAFIRSLKDPAEDLNLNTLKVHKVDILDNDDEKGQLAVSDVYLTDLYGTTATLGSADIGNITCNKITFGDLSLDKDVLSSLLEAWNPSDGDNQEIKGEKTFVDHVEFNDAYIDRYELGTGFVGGDMTVDANIVPETTTSWLGNNTHPWGCVATQSIRNTWVENGVDHVGEILVFATTLKPDPNANVSGLGDSSDPWEVAYIQTLNVTEGLSCEGTGYISDILANTISCSGQADFSQITCSGNIVCDGITSHGDIVVDNGSKFVGNLDGVIPYVEASNFNETVPIGCIVFLRVEYLSNILGTLNVGAKLTSGSSQYNLFIGCFSATGLYEDASSSSLAEGQVFRTLSRGYCENKVTHVLAIRVDET